MTTLDDLFAKRSDSLHPRVRDWKRRIDAGASAKVEVYRSESEVGESIVEMNLHFIEGGRQLPLETIPWNDELNSGLIQLGVKALSAENESERFALGLRSALRRPEREFGDGYFNAVFVEFIKESGLAQHDEIAEVLKHAYANRADREGRAHDRYTVCRELIADAISGRAHELTESLKYSAEDAKAILVSSLAQYLDARFSVTSRRRFGLLRLEG